MKKLIFILPLFLMLYCTNPKSVETEYYSGYASKTVFNGSLFTVFKIKNLDTTITPLAHVHILQYDSIRIDKADSIEIYNTDSCTYVLAFFNEKLDTSICDLHLICNVFTK